MRESDSVRKDTSQPEDDGYECRGDGGCGERSSNACWRPPNRERPFADSSICSPVRPVGRKEGTADQQREGIEWRTDD